MSLRPLGRRPPTDWGHADKHPFAAAPAPTKPFNSWGRDYPHRTRLLADDLQWLLERDGEAGIPLPYPNV